MEKVTGDLRLDNFRRLNFKRRRHDRKVPLFIGQPEFSSGVRSPRDRSQIPAFIMLRDA